MHIEHPLLNPVVVTAIKTLIVPTDGDIERACISQLLLCGYDPPSVRSIGWGTYDVGVSDRLGTEILVDAADDCGFWFSLDLVEAEGSERVGPER